MILITYFRKNKDSELMFHVMINSKIRLALSLVTLMCSFSVSYARDFVIRGGETVGLILPKDVEPVVKSALEMLKTDLRVVLQADLNLCGERKARIICRWDDSLPREGFRLEVDAKGKLNVGARDSHALAYALLEISRLMDVSPWEWWADCTPRKKPELRLQEGYRDEQHPAVAFRGIFINDEDWGLTPWATRQLRAGALAGMKDRYADGTSTNANTLKRLKAQSALR